MRRDIVVVADEDGDYVVGVVAHPLGDGGEVGFESADIDDIAGSVAEHHGAILVVSLELNCVDVRWRMFLIMEGFVLRGFLTHSNAIVELGRHVQRLVCGRVTFTHERAVMGCDHGDIGVVARAELGIVVARASVNDRCLGGGGRRGGRRIHGPIAKGRCMAAAHQNCQGV